MEPIRKTLKRLAIALLIVLGSAVQALAFLAVGEGAKWDDYMATYSESDSP